MHTIYSGPERRKRPRSAWRNGLFFAAMVLSTKHVFAAACTAAAAAVTAAGCGVDPVPWALGGFGAAVVYVKRPPTSRADAIINAAISIVIGGVLAPVAAVAVGEYVNPKLESSWAMALVMSSLWPWLVPMALAWAKGRAKEASNG